jgi:hypothetical protein
MIDFIILLISFEVIDGNEIVYRDYVDISVAVASPKVTDENEEREKSIEVLFRVWLCLFFEMLKK